MIITQLHTPTQANVNGQQVLSASLNQQPAVCQICHGTGQVSPAVLAEGITSTSTCPDCEGTGVIIPAQVPHTSVVEAAGWLIIDLEMTGVVARDLDVAVEHQQVTIKTLPRIDAPDTPVRITRNYMQQAVERVIELPQPIDMHRSDAIRATLLDGVLRLVLPIMRSDADLSTDSMYTN